MPEICLIMTAVIPEVTVLLLLLVGGDVSVSVTMMLPSEALQTQRIKIIAIDSSLPINGFPDGGLFKAGLGWVTV